MPLRLVVLLGWAGALFAVQTAFAMSTFGVTAWVVSAYLLGLAATFPLHEKTRGPLALIVAFGLSWALFIEGIAYAVVAENDGLSSRLVSGALLGLPLFSLVVRRFAADAEDAWFVEHARRVVALALVVAVPLLAVGALGSFRADPAPYDRASRALGYNPLEALLFGGVVIDRTEHGRSRFGIFESSFSGVDPEVQNEVKRRCGPIAAKDPWRACGCADEFLGSRLREVGARRDTFRKVALWSSLPWAIALLFAWRGLWRPSDAR